MSFRAASARATALLLAGCGAPADPTRATAVAALARGSYAAPELGGARIHYLRAGDPAGRRVILVHGTPGSAKAWIDMLVDPSPGLEFIAIDRPGFGASMPGMPEPSLARQAAALMPLLVRRRGGWPILVGHSYGGPVIARLAADMPGKVGGLLIAADALDPAQERINPLQWAGRWFGIRALLPRALYVANEELIPLEGELERLALLLDRVTAPVTIVHGTKDTLVPYANTGYMVPRFMRAAKVRVVTVKDGSHFLPWEHRAVLASAIRELTR